MLEYVRININCDKYSCDNLYKLSYILIMILSCMVPSTVCDTDKTKNKLEDRSPDVDYYLVGEIEGDQDMDYSVTPIDSKIFTATQPWWETRATKSSASDSFTTENYPVFTLMANVSSLGPDEKQALLNDPARLNNTVEQHILILHGYRKPDAYNKIEEQIRAHLENAIDIARILAEEKEKRSSLALMTVDNITMLPPIDDYSMLLMENTTASPDLIDLYKIKNTFSNDNTFIATTETLIPEISVRQQMENEQKTTHIPNPIPMDPDDHLVTEEPPEVLEDLALANVTTTMCPLLVNIKENMLALKNGPFSGFLHGFLGVLALKHRFHTKDLFIALNRVIDSKVKAKKYDEAISNDAGFILKRAVSLLNSLPVRLLPTLITNFKNVVEIRSAILDKESLQLFDELDQFYTTEEAEALLNTIIPIYEYPNGKSSDEVVEEFEDCLFKPFINTPPTQLVRKALILELMQKELVKRGLLGLRSNCKGSNCDKDTQYKQFRAGHNNLNKSIITTKTSSRLKNDYIYSNTGAHNSQYRKHHRGDRKQNKHNFDTEISSKFPTKRHKMRPALHRLRPRPYYSNNQQGTRYNPSYQYAQNKEPKQLRNWQPLRELQSRYLTPRSELTYRNAQEKKLKLFIRRNYNSKDSIDSSYSDHETDSKYNLKDPIRHPQPTIRNNNTEQSGGKIKVFGRKETKESRLDESKYSDEEGIIKKQHVHST